MPPTTREETTALLERVAAGDRSAEGRLYQVLREELRARAGALMRGQREGHTLQPTALVHEAWLRLVGPAGQAFHSRAHFLGVAVKAMRSVLIDHARARRAAKRGGEPTDAGLDAAVAGLEGGTLDLLDLEAALAELERDDAELARLVELRFFGGLPLPEVAAVLGVSLSTAERHWRLARAHLHRRLASPGSEDTGT